MYRRLERSQPSRSAENSSLKEPLFTAVEQTPATRRHATRLTGHAPAVKLTVKGVQKTRTMSMPHEPCHYSRDSKAWQAATRAAKARDLTPIRAPAAAKLHTPVLGMCSACTARHVLLGMHCSA